MAAVLQKPFPHSNKQWCYIEVRAAKIHQLYENAHFNLAMVLLFECTEVKHGKGLLTMKERAVQKHLGLHVIDLLQVDTLNHLPDICQLDLTWKTFLLAMSSPCSSP